VTDEGTLVRPTAPSAAQLAATGARVREGVPLAELTTLRVGGPARLVADCPTEESLLAALRTVERAGGPSLLLGGGSNVLVADAGFDGVVVRPTDDTVVVDGERVRVAAGADWDAVVAATVRAGLGGLECLSGIPGSAGATPVQNVGAYGVEVASPLRRVKLYDRVDDEVSWVGPERLDFGYRTSVLKTTRRAVVLAVEFGLRCDGRSAPIRYRELAAALDVEEGERLQAAQVRAAVLGLRARKGMVLDANDHDTWSAGSFFTNPVVDAERLPAILAAIAARTGVTEDTVPRYRAGDDRVKLSAGWLIERAGFGKGYPGAGARARLSTKHTLALTNRGAATAAELAALAREVRDGVASAFGVRLEPEPIAVGLDI
jgi:UDP-N-acetylmuramate dehydrogenase